ANECSYSLHFSCARLVWLCSPRPWPPISGWWLVPFAPSLSTLHRTSLTSTAAVMTKSCQKSFAVKSTLACFKAPRCSTTALVTELPLFGVSNHKEMLHRTQCHWPHHHPICQLLVAW